MDDAAREWDAEDERSRLLRSEKGIGMRIVMQEAFGMDAFLGGTEKDRISGFVEKALLG
jgi:hypothetical protein